MGLPFVLPRPFGKKRMRVLMVGLHGAGKTTILYTLKRGEQVESVAPSVDYNVETFEYDDVEFTVWDAVDGNRMSAYWRHAFRDIRALILVVDSGDRQRVAKAKRKLEKTMLMEDDFRDVALLVFANKQDVPGAMTESEVANELGLDRLVREKRYEKVKWHVQASCAARNQGLYEGLQWLSKYL